MKEVQSHQRKEIKREREKTSFFPRKQQTNKNEIKLEILKNTDPLFSPFSSHSIIITTTVTKA
jgi:hypothetical protein